MGRQRGRIRYGLSRQAPSPAHWHNPDMSRRVYVHIGAPKTGTTYLQDRLGRNVKELASHDVHIPTRAPLMSPGMFHFRAALDLLGQDWGGPAGHAQGNWDAMVRRVRRANGTS